jgi:hypothetical protein
MADNTDQIRELLEKLTILMRRQEIFSADINALRLEINNLRTAQGTYVPGQNIETPSDSISPVADLAIKKEAEKIIPAQAIPQPVATPVKIVEPKISTGPQEKSNIEKFIGENLINKIGIAITVIGVGIGAKYSIEHQLISPLTRIILGYLMGIALLGTGIKLKKNYKNYSAVLVSGAIAIFYFITFSAYNFYELIPQTLAFALMVIFTVFTVIAALHYNMQVIAHIGLVGAYAVPFLLSDGSGKVAVLYSYMVIINCGILFIAFKKYWKPLYYVAYFLTWLIYAGWWFSKYNVYEHFSLALVFLCMFFITFYSIFLGYKLIRKEKFGKSDIVLLLSNSFIFYGFGYAIFHSHETGRELLGVFTLCNAVIHFIVSAIIYKKKLADRNLFFMIAGLVLVFITITIPVQLDGNWVTMLWAGEAALMFWIGRTKSVATYERLSYPLIILAFSSLVGDWFKAFTVYSSQISYFTPIFNVHFLAALIVVTSFGFITYLNITRKNSPFTLLNIQINHLLDFLIPILLLIVIYFAFEMEITLYFDQLYNKSDLNSRDAVSTYVNYNGDPDIKRYKDLWLMNYTALFFILLSFFNIRKIKNKNLGIANLVLNVVVLYIFLANGSFVLKALRESYLTTDLTNYYPRTISNLGMRYICFTFIAVLIYAIYKYIQQEFIRPAWNYFKLSFDMLLHITIIWVASSELITWMDVFHFGQSFKLGLSILWGIYALLLIIMGISKKKKHLRIAAIVLFAITLIKLFFYDIAQMQTIAKTIVFVSLGILLLIISFLYNKYKHLISDEHEN